MKHTKTYKISLLTTCIICMYVMYFGARCIDEKGLIDLGSIYTISNMVNL